MLGGTEETTTGLVRLRALEAEGGCACPVIAVNEARAERAFNDRFGTGQSVLDGILRATNLLLAGPDRGRARLRLDRAAASRCARTGSGASVIVCEVDPLRALEARMEGFDGDAGAGGRRARRRLHHRHRRAATCCAREHFARMKDGAVLANAGHFDVEISLDDLRAAAVGGVREVLPLVERYELGDRALNLLAQGRVVNLAAAEGHPAAVMDSPSRCQALAVEDLVLDGAGSSTGVHRGAGRDRPRGRAAEARSAGRRDRRADARAAGLPELLGGLTGGARAPETGVYPGNQGRHDDGGPCGPPSRREALP